MRSLKRSLAHRVVVTGLGIVCPLGTGVKYVWENLLQGKSGVSSVDGERYRNIPCKVAAFVPEGEGEGQLDLNKHFKAAEMKTFSRSTAYGLIAAEEALRDSAWFPEQEEDRVRTGVAVGTGMVDLTDIVNEGTTLQTKGYSKVSPYFVTRILANMAAGHISIRNGFRGPNHSVSTACASGAHAIGDAFNFIMQGTASVMVCGATEAVISPLSLAAFSRIRALSTKFNSMPSEASRPFDRARDGFVMGEGAGIIVLESLQHAVERNAKIYAELIGYGMSGDAHHVAAPTVDGRGAYQCMKNALEACGYSPEAVGYINAHATSTPLGDAAEISAIKNLFQTHTDNLVVSSTKGATGHLLGSAGSVEAIFTILSCSTGKIPPTVNLNEYDCDPGVQVISKKFKMWTDDHRVPHIGVTNSFGFGGTNASLVFSDFHP